MDVFRCPKCHDPLHGWPPATRCAGCGLTISTRNDVYLFADSHAAARKVEPISIGYDEIAEGYDRCLHPEELRSQLFAAYAHSVARRMPGEGVILDLGCGPGSYALELAKHGCRVIAADISVNMLEILASRLSPGVRRLLVPCRLDAHDIPLLDDAMDAVLALNMLHFVGMPDLVVQEIKRVLKSGGCLITSGPISEESLPEHQAGPTFGLVRQYYGEELRRASITEAKPPGWTSREIEENLTRYFTNREMIDGPGLEFDYRVRAGWLLEKLRQRYTAFQIGIDPGVHERAIAIVRERLAREFGADWERLMTKHHAAHSLVAHSG